MEWYNDHGDICLIRNILHFFSRYCRDIMGMSSANDRRRYNIMSSHWLSPYAEWSLYCRVYPSKHVYSFVGFWFYRVVLCGCMWFIHPYPIRLCHWHSGNRMVVSGAHRWRTHSPGYGYNQSVQTMRSCDFPWWRHQMETFSALLALCAGNSPVTGKFSVQRPMTRSFDVFFDLRLNKRLRK